MLVSERGILLKTIEYGNSSCILRILTAEYGILSLMWKGAFSKANQVKRHILQPMACLEFSFYDKQNRNMPTVLDISTQQQFFHVVNDPRRANILFVMQEVLWNLHQSFPAADSEIEFHAFTMQFLGETPFPKYVLSNWLIHTLELTSIQPNFFPIPEKDAYFDFLLMEWGSSVTDLHKHKVQEWIQVAKAEPYSECIQSDSLRHELIAIILRYLQFQVPNFKQLKSLNVIGNIFS